MLRADKEESCSKPRFTIFAILSFVHTGMCIAVLGMAI